MLFSTISFRVEQAFKNCEFIYKMLNNDRSSNFQHMTRAHNILLNARQEATTLVKSKRAISSIANDLGIKVRYEDEFRVFPQSSKECCMTRKGPRRRKLESPFLKVEDHSRSHRPLFKEMDSWPTISFESVQPNCPFDPPVGRSPRRPRSQARSSCKGGRAKVSRQRSSKGKVGYCELCRVMFQKLNHHLQGPRHRNNATSSVPFKELDDMFRRGISMNEYLRMLKTRSRIATPRSKLARLQKHFLDKKFAHICVYIFKISPLSNFSLEHCHNFYIDDFEYVGKYCTINNCIN